MRISDWSADVCSSDLALNEAWEYSQQRKQFGKPICTFQAIRHSLADCRTKLEACRLMVYWAASRVEQGCATIADTSMTKLFVTEPAKDIVRACQQVMGAYGYAVGFGMERLVRDVRLEVGRGGKEWGCQGRMRR